jgi:predicted cupin superfamily sugar epimerase
VLVPAGCWQAAVPHFGEFDYVLVGNTVAPGFSFSDWQLADAAAIEALCARHPDARDALVRYARPPR